MSWLHLSDIHFNIQNYDSVILREKLIEYIENIDKKIDFVVISGDIAYQGGKYNKATCDFIIKVLETCDLTEKEIIIVPGNHDLTRSATRESIVKDIQSRSEYSDFDSSHRDELLKGQKLFFAFYKKIMKTSGKTEFEINEHFIYNINGVSVVCINTAISCGIADEEGKLKIDLNKLHQALHSLDKNNINIAVGHHALDCFSTHDREAIFHEFEDHNVLLYLCGHYHTSSSHINADGDKQIETLISGATFKDDYAKPSFIIGTLDFISGKGKAEFFLWDNTNQQWVINTTVGRNAKNGVKQLSLLKTSNNDNDFLTIDRSELEKFILKFQEILKDENREYTPDENNVPKEIYDKFQKMKCNHAFRKQFKNYSVYFPTVRKLMSSPHCSYESRLMITSEIVEKYTIELNNYPTGDLVFEAMIKNLVNNYKNSLSDIKNEHLNLYFRIFVYWLIYECDIFDDEK